MPKPFQRRRERREARHAALEPRARTTPRPARRSGRILFALGLLAALTFASYAGTFDHAFVNWDDPDYVEENTLVQRKQVGTLLGTVVSSNYHPLTMLSLALNASQPLSPKPFLVTNVVLHTLNTGLVFWLAFSMSGRRILVGFFVALFFGIHPMHVESVAWVSERKDVLYSFFLLAGAITYWHYLRRRTLPWLAGTFALFVLSCLSKGMAVVFPLLLMLLDYWKRRPVFERRAVLEKAPFFAVAALFGLIAIDVQGGGDFHGLFYRVDKHLKGLADTLPFSPLERAVLPTYGHMMYVWRLFVPVDLSAFYPYPSPGEVSQPKYLLAPLFFLATLALVIWDARRTRIFAFGVGWYLVTIAPVLQWLPVGEAILADRYAYLSYFGLFFALTMGIAALAGNRAVTTALWIACGLFAVFLFVRTVRQVETWKDGETLWSTVIRHYPRSEMAYASRGNHRGRAGRIQEAMDDLQTALRLGSRRGNLYDGLGNAYGTLGNLDSALVMFNRGLSLEPNMGRTHYNRAIAYLRLGRPREALVDLVRAEELLPLQVSTLHLPRGNAYMQLGRDREAVAEFDRAVEAGVRDANVFYNRGLTRLRLGDPAGAAADFREAVRLNPALESAVPTNVGPHGFR